jgi:hypothetical protein
VTDAQLLGRLRRAFEPYLSGFCQLPIRVELRLMQDRIDADVFLDPEDFQAVTDNIQRAQAIREAFNELCRANDKTRGPSLDFREAT